MDGAIALDYSCIAVVSSNPRLCFFLFLLCSCTVYCCSMLCNCTRMVGGWVVGEWMVLLLYSCTTVALSCCCYSRPLPPARSVDRAVDRSPPPSPGRPWASPARSLAGRRSFVRPPLLAHRRSPVAALVGCTQQYTAVHSNTFLLVHW